MNTYYHLRAVFLFSLSIVAVPLFAESPPAPDAVRAAMHKATACMFDRYANHGGFVWWYDLKDDTPYGELKARPSMIWVEPPSTPSVGNMLLESYAITGDSYYLDCASKVADALIRGQHPAGGWQYYIDFEPAGTHAYWGSFFSKCWGWQEHMKWRTNCTFDDFATSEPTRFFMRLCKVRNEARFIEARDKALGFILRAQYPDGAWPQRYPLDEDYSAYSTFNDSVIADCISVLLEAHESVGGDVYYKAARKGMDFYLLAQLPEPQPGWAQQYTRELKPGWGRPFELDTVSAGQTLDNIQDLMRFYRITGDKKYLEPIPRALDWLERVRFKDVQGYTHTYFYEAGTDRPMYVLQTGTTVDDVKFTPTYDPVGCYPYGDRISIPLDALRGELKNLSESKPETVQAAYQKEQVEKALPKESWGLYLYRVLAITKDTPEGVADILRMQDARGLWVEEISQLDPFSPFTAPPYKAQGYTTGGYIGRMYRMLSYLKAHS